MKIIDSFGFELLLGAHTYTVKPVGEIRRNSKIFHFRLIFVSAGLIVSHYFIGGTYIYSKILGEITGNSKTLHFKQIFTSASIIVSHYFI